ncbi:MAG: hypothetical protein WAK82_26435 [Streptosporangiaceae bacterium]
MSPLAILAWVIFAALVTWCVATARSIRHTALLREQIEYWHNEALQAYQETDRARAAAAQVARDAEVRAEAWREGWNEVVRLLPMVASARVGTDPDAPGDEEEKAN